MGLKGDRQQSATEVGKSPRDVGYEERPNVQMMVIND